MARTDHAGLPGLSPEQQALFTALLEEAEIDLPQPLGITPQARTAPLPLSFAQERLWVLDQLTPNSTAYIIPAAMRLEGTIDLGALHQALGNLVQRHETLRTTFPLSQDRPVQVIAPAMPLPLTVVDLTALPACMGQTVALQLATDLMHHPFDLARGPLMRTRLIRLDRAESILLLTVHHSIADGWSIRLLVRDLAALYLAVLNGHHALLPELPIQYADFAVWQRQWLQADHAATQLAYWRQQLDGAPATLELPTDYERPAVQTYRGDAQEDLIPASITTRLTALSQRQSGTLFMTMLAAFSLLLQRQSAQDDFVVGTPIAGRPQPELEGLLGCFLNNLALRLNLSGNPTFEELLRRVRTVCLEAYTHQDVPFEYLLEHLPIQRAPGRTPVFQVFLNMLEFPDPYRALTRSEQVTMTPVALPQTASRFDLTLYVRHVPDGIHLRWLYNIDLFEAGRITCLRDQFRHLLTQIAADPTRRIDEYTLVTPDTQPFLPDPRLALPEPRTDPVSTMVAGWAVRTPDQPAICQGDHTWSYDTLVSRAQSLAHMFLSNGLGPGQVIAVRGPSNFGLITSMLAVLMSGGTLLAIDVHLPIARQRLMLREANARWLVEVGSETELGEEQAAEAWRVIRVDPATACPAEPIVADAVASLPMLNGDDPAYIFFTSGTTGLPKGVLGTHKGLSHFLAWQRDTFAIGPGDRVAQLTALSFDVVLRDIFLPLVSGATLYLPEIALSPGAILPWLDAVRISVLHTVPALVQAWLTPAPVVVTLRTLRWVFFAGEPLPATLVRRWRAAFPESGELVNLYGPTETTLAKCFYQVPADPPPGIQPVGNPLPQTQALILDPSGQLCGVGEPGEIVIRTPFATKGYINLGADQRQAFVPNPYRHDSRDILYFTGDRGRYRPDGGLEILGRLDQQVKIRGVRVEPEEITAVLAHHAAVAACLVTAWEPMPGNRVLAAYLTAGPPGRVPASELRSYLHMRLPSALVPATFIWLDQFPLTPTGKIDRQALPPPADQSLEADAVYVAPQTGIERTLAAAWQEILQVKTVGRHDNFFDLGGHSLLLVQLHSKLQATFTTQHLSIVNLFHYPTIHALAQYLTQHQRQAVTIEHRYERAATYRQSIRRQRQRRTAHRDQKK